MFEYLKIETDHLIGEKLPVRVIYRDSDQLYFIWASTPTGDQERHVADEVFPNDEVIFEITP